MNVSVTPQELTITITPPALGTSTGTPIARDFVERDPYTGEYTIIPSEEAQTIPVKDLRMTDDLTIEPIPQNYGLITWDGSTLLVS